MTQLVEVLIGGRVYRLPPSEVAQGALHSCNSEFIECDICHSLACLECDSVRLEECVSDEDELYVLCDNCLSPCETACCPTCYASSEPDSESSSPTTEQPSSDDFQDEAYSPLLDTPFLTATYPYPEAMFEDQRPARGCRHPQIHRPPRG